MKRPQSLQLFNKHLRFSIRKLSVGIVSLAIGAFFVGGGLSSPVQADSQVTTSLSHSPLTQYNYVTEDELSADEKALIQEGLPTTHDAHCHNYYLVYRPAGNSILPSTASQALSLLTVGGQVLFVVLGISLVASSRGKKERLVSSIMLITLSGTIFVPSIQALQSQKLSAYNQVYHLQTGQKMPDVAEIPGYKYIGYLSLCSCQDKVVTDLLPASSSETETSLSSSKTEASSKISESFSSSVVTGKPEQVATVPGSSTAPLEEVKGPVAEPKPEGESIQPEPAPSQPTKESQAVVTVPSSSQVVKEVEKEALVPSSSQVIKETEAVVTVPSSTQVVKEVETIVTVPSATTVTTTEEVVKEVLVEVPVVKTSETISSTTTSEGKVETIVSEVETIVTVPSATTVTTSEEVVKEVLVEVPVVKTSETVIESSTTVETTVLVPTETKTEQTLVPSSTKETVVETVPASSTVSPVPELPASSTSPVKEVPVSPSSASQPESSSSEPSSSSIASQPESSSSEPSSSSSTSQPESSSSEPSSSSSASQPESSSSEPSSSSSTSQPESSSSEPSSSSSASQPESSSSEPSSSSIASQAESSSSEPSSSSSASQAESSSSEPSSSSIASQPESSSSEPDSTPSSSTEEPRPDEQEEEPVVDKSALAQLVSQDPELQETIRYVYADVQAKEQYDQALQAAQQVLLTNQVTQEQVDASLLSLKEAMERLNGRLKATPELSLTKVEKDDDAANAQLSYRLSDPDQAIERLIVRVYDADKLVKEVSVTDLSQPFEIKDLSYGVPYTFESELVYNLRDGQQSKTVSHDQTVELSLKAEPSLALVEVVKNDDTRSARLTFELIDRDKTVSGGLVKVYEGDQLVKEVSVTDFSEPVDLSDLSYGVPYRFKTDLTYDLRDGQQSKTVSHDQTVELSLKAEPSLALVEVVKNDDTRSARLTFELTDRDKTVSGGLVKVYNGDQLVKEVSVTDFSEPVDLSDLSYGVPYRFKTDLTYDLRDGQQSKTVSHDQTVTLIERVSPVPVLEKKLVFKDISQIGLYRVVNGELVKQTSFTESQTDLSHYVVKIESSKYKDVLLPVSRLEGNQVGLLLPELVQDKPSGYAEGLNFSLGQIPVQAPNYQDLAGYDSQRQIAYANMEKLLPFYNKETILDYGNKVDPANKLYTTELVSLVPMVDNQFVTDYYSQHEQINRLLLHYKDNTVAYVNLVNGRFFKNSPVKEYQLAGSELIYTPEQLIQAQDSLINELAQELQKLNYFESLENLYPNFIYPPALVNAEMEQLKTESYAEAVASLRRQQVDPLYLEKSYHQVKAGIKTYLQSLLSQEAVYAPANATSTYLRDKILKHKEKLMLGLAYLNRLYDINYDQQNIKGLSLFRQDFFGQPVRPIDLLEQIGGAGLEKLEFANSAALYRDYLGLKNGKATIMDYLSAYNRLLTDKSDNDWFKSASKAYIVESPSQAAPAANSQVYQSLAKERYQSYILPLLTLSEDGLFIISNMTSLNFGMYDRAIDMSLKESDPPAYAAAVAEYQAKIRQTADWQRAYYDVWYRLAKDKVKELLHARSDMPIANWDGYRMENGHWMRPYGDTASSRMTDFFAPIGKWYRSNGTAANANGTTTYFVVDTMIGDKGQGTMTHEMTHNLDTSVFLGGYGRRLGPEAYAMGFLESPWTATNKELGLNLFADYAANGSRRNYNASPERFQNSQDLQEFVRGMFDVLHTLEAIEGEVYLETPKYKQRQIFRRLLVEGVNTRNTAFTDDKEWSQLNFTSLADLVNQRVLIGTHQDYRSNRDYGMPYQMVQLFSAMYSAITYERTLPDSLTFRRLAYEILAEAGYDGMLKYASDQLRKAATATGQPFNDRYIIQEIFAGRYQSFEEFKLDMLTQRLAKAQKGDLKPVSFTYNGQTYRASYRVIKQLMQDAVDNNLYSLPALKEAIYQAYLAETDDFRQSIYRD
ncbi:ZmpA/ZmpB/ZmpC family metallo-endopeptidase [Streptococcus cuniculipharyngis]